MIANDWVFDRPDHQELFVSLETDAGNFQLVLQWLEGKRALQINCRLPAIIPADKIGEAVLIANEVNNNIWIGNFIIDRDQAAAIYSYTALFSNRLAENDRSYLSRLIDNAIEQCERMAVLFNLMASDTPIDTSMLTLVMTQNAGHA